MENIVIIAFIPC